MRYLLLISLLLAAACATTHPKTLSDNQNLPSFKWDTTVTYKANISVMNRSYTGLVIFNRENDSTCRMILTTGVGPKLVDMTLTSKGYSKTFAIKQLNRKDLLNMLWEDFGTMLNLFSNQHELIDSSTNTYCYPVGRKHSACYVYDTVQSLPSNAYFMERNKKKTKISYFCGVENQPDSIVIEHLSFNMSYFLNKLN